MWRYAPSAAARGAQSSRGTRLTMRASRAGPRLRQPGAEPTPPRPVRLRVPRPVDQEGLAADLLAPHETPVAAVLGVVAVVAHDEVRAGRHHRGLAAVEVAAMGRRHGGNGAGADVGLFDHVAVQDHAVVDDLDGVAPYGHDALDEVARLVVGVLE